MDPMAELNAYLRAHGVSHFTAEEVVRLGLTHGHVVNAPPPDRELWPHIVPTLAILERVRLVTGPLVVLSGWRTKEYNTAVGGKPASMHKQFNAIDWRPAHFENWSMRDLDDLVTSRGTSAKYLGIGVYTDAHPEDSVKTGFIHLDTRGLVFGMKGARWAGTI